MIEQTILEDNQAFAINCDGCSNYEFFLTSDFWEAVKQAKGYGWIFKLNGEKKWEHYCSKRCMK